MHNYLYHNVTFSLDQPAHDYIKLLSKEHGITQSGYLRQLLRKEYYELTKREERTMDDLLIRTA
jgi:hypothetical protein